MKAKDDPFTFLGQAGQVIVPYFQRPYVWKRDNWEDLLDELAQDRSHFLGSVILKQLHGHAGAHRKVLVIDGQQRLTTLSILVRALFDGFPDQLQQACQNYINEYLLFKFQATDQDFHVRIQHSRLDAPAYEGVIRGNSASAWGAIGPKAHRVEQCYAFFRAELELWQAAARERLFNDLMSPTRKILVVIDLEAHENEQAIFDTINAAGVRLSVADIVKNALYQRYRELARDDSRTERLYNQTWESVFLKDEDSVAFWETDKATGRLRRTNQEILLHCCAVIEGFFDPDKHGLSDLADLYRDRFQSAAEPDLVKLAESIKAYAESYRECFERGQLLEYSSDVARLVHILEVLDVSTFHPFVLHVMRTGATNGTTVPPELLKLERFIVRGTISGKTEPKNFNKLCIQFIKNPGALDTELTKYDDPSVEMGVCGLTNKQAALILFWIELHRRHNDGKQGVKALKYNYSLEHIMPQEWRTHWANVPPKTRPDGTGMSVEEAEEDRIERISWLGNMTLLTSSLNSALRHFDFQTKLNGSGRKKGIKHYDDLSITKDVSGKNSWSETDIEERTVQLCAELKAIWPP